jgi:hypothetical protein
LASRHRGKSAEKFWQSPFRGTAHRHTAVAALPQRIATRFATSLPQDLAAPFVFESGGFGRTRLKPFAWFGILRRPLRR